jgi:hypothetical protein
LKDKLPKYVALLTATYGGDAPVRPPDWDLLVAGDSVDEFWARVRAVEKSNELMGFTSEVGPVFKRVSE